MGLENVYAPGEDTYLFIDALRKNKILFSNSVILEIGCGSGEIMAFLKNICTNSLVVGSDINIDALLASGNRLEDCSFLMMDLLNGITQQNIDVVIFNPPYVETEHFSGREIEASYSGGTRGRAVIDKIISSLQVRLLFLLLIRKNAPWEVFKSLEQKGYCIEVVERRRILGETLIVIKASITS